MADIYKSDGTTVSLPDFAITNTFYDATANSGHGKGIQLIGLSATDYVKPLAQSLLQITENFAGSLVPLDSTSLQGQLWFNKLSSTTGKLYVRKTSLTAGGISNWEEVITGTTAVNPGSYINANITVDQYGRVTSASNGTGTGLGTVTSVGILGTSDFVVSNSPITTSGNISLGLSNTGVAAGYYTTANITVDAKGRITSISNGTSAGTGTVTSVAATGSTSIVVTGSPITTNGTLAFDLANTGITPGTFGSSTQVPIITVDAKGRITGVVNTNISGGGTVTSVAVVGTSDVSVSGSPITTSGTLTVGLTNTGVTAAQYGSATHVPVFTVDAKGRIISVTNTAISGTGTVTSVGASGGTTGLSFVGSPVTTAGTFTLTGTLGISHGGTGATTVTAAINNLLPMQAGNAGKHLTTNGTSVSWEVASSGSVTSVAATGSADITVGGSPITSTGTLTFALANTAVTAGSYTNANITVDSKGRITSASNGAASGGVTSVSVVTANGISGSVATATTTPAITLSLGNITPASVAATGTVTGSNLSGTNTGDQTITLTGDVSGSGTGTFATALSTTGVTAGTYTNTNITVDAKGRVTSATSNTTPTFTSVTANTITTSNLTFSGTGAVEIASGNDLNLVAAGNITFSTIAQLASKTKAQLLLLTAAPAGSIAFCSDTISGAVPVYFNGTSWLKIFDNGAI